MEIEGLCDLDLYNFIKIVNNVKKRLYQAEVIYKAIGN